MLFPAAADLIGQAVQRAGEAVHGSAEGQVGVGQGAAHQVAGVGADVAAFVVAVGAEKTRQSSEGVPGSEKGAERRASVAPHLWMVR